MCTENTWKTNTIAFWERTDNMWKPHPLLSETAVTTYGNPSTAYWMGYVNIVDPLLFKIEQWQHVENHIHCLVKQQWQHMEIIHCLLNVMWQHMENNIHCSLKVSSDNMWKITSTATWNSVYNIWKSIHCLLNVLWQHMENNIHCSWKWSSDNMWKTTSTA